MKIGVIGGSGLYSLEGLTGVRDVDVETPFGKPSDSLVCGKLHGFEVVFLPRHGRGHRILPSEINHRANIYAFKVLGVERVISVSAVGSLREDLRPRDIVLPDQYYDRTKQWLNQTFFGEGIAGHVSFAEPACHDLRKTIAESARQVISQMPEARKVHLHVGGVYVNMEGPAFSTKTESHAYRKLGFDIIGMTSLPEAKLCREAEICYQAMAMVTDYDCWREAREPVTVEMVVAHLSANTALAKAVLLDLLPRLAHGRTCACGSAMRDAIITSREAIPTAVRERLSLLLGKYVK